MSGTPPAPGVRVVVEASRPLRSRSFTHPMYAEFAPGLRYPLSAGRNEFTIPAGSYRVQLYSPFLLRHRIGKAEIDLDLRGEPVRFFYAAPYLVWSRGAAGFEPQRRRGLGSLLAIAAGGALFVLLGTLLAALR